MIRKRAPGGGRKPQGDTSKSVSLSVRITPDLRAALQREADRSKRTLSVEVAMRLKRSLEQPKKSERLLAPHNRALGSSISQIAQRIEMHTGHRWQANAFSGETLKSAVEIFLSLSQIAPTGEICVPENVEQSFQSALEAYEAMRPHRREHVPKPTAEYKTPEAVGSAIALGFWEDLKTADFPPMNHPRNQQYAFEFYAMPQIRKDLGLEPLQKRKK
jgi:hypothetical protein